MRPGIWGRLRMRPRPRSAMRRAPSVPGSLSAVGSVGRATLSWSASTDNVGVLRYNVHRGTSAGFTATLANRIAQPGSPGYVDVTAPGSYFYKVTAEDAAGNVSAVSNEATATVLADTTAPSQPVGLGGLCRRQHRQPQLDCLQRQRRCHSLQPAPLEHGRLHTQPRKQDRAADRGQLRRHRPGHRQLLLQGHRRRRGRQHQRRLERGNRNRRRRDSADSARLTRRQRCRQHRQPQLGGRHRQRRRQPLQPPPRHHERLCPQPGQPDRATDRAQLRRHRPRPRQLLLQADRRRRRRQHQPRLQHRQRHRRTTQQRRAHRQTSPPQAAPARPASPGPQPQTTSPSAATTSTAPPAAASPPAPATESHNPPPPATPTPASPPAPTTTS